MIPGGLDIRAMNALSIMQGHMDFLLRHKGTVYSENDFYIINEKNIFNNNLQNGDNYSPNGSAVTEAQSFIILGMLWSYKATGDTSWLDKAKLYAQAYIDVFYNIHTLPNNVTPDTYWLCHWQVNGKYPFVSQGPQNYFDLGWSGNLDTQITFVNGIGQIPTGSPYFGEKLFKVYQVFNGVLDWTNVDAVLRSGSVIPFAYYVDENGVKWDSGRNNIGTDINIGRIVLQDTTFNGTLGVNFSTSTGPTIDRHVPFETWPMWSPVSPEEYGNAVDAEQWFAEGCYLLFLETGEETFHKAWLAASNTLKNYYASFDPQAYMFAKNPFAYLFSEGVSYSWDYSPNNVSSLLYRDGNNYAHISKNEESFDFEYSTNAFEQIEIINECTQNSSITFQAGSTSNTTKLDVTVLLRDAVMASVGDNNQKWRYSMTPYNQSYVDTLANGSAPPNPDNYFTFTVPFSKFVGYTDTTGSDYTVIDGGSITAYNGATFTREYGPRPNDGLLDFYASIGISTSSQGAVCGFWSNTPSTRPLTSLTYRNGLNCAIKVTDALGNNYGYDLPNNTGWATLALDWTKFYLMSGATGFGTFSVYGDTTCSVGTYSDGGIIPALYQGAEWDLNKPFMGYIAGNTLTVTQAPTSTAKMGMYDLISGSGALAQTVVTALGSGTGGTGTYTVNNSQNVGSAASPVALNAFGVNSWVNGIFTLQNMSTTGTTSFKFDFYSEYATTVEFGITDANATKFGIAFEVSAGWQTLQAQWNETYHLADGTVVDSSYFTSANNVAQLVLFGDSLTDKTWNEELSYGDQLTLAHNMPPVLNTGIAGTTSSQILTTLMSWAGNWLEAQTYGFLPNFVTPNYLANKHVIIWAGRNDFYDNIAQVESNIAQMVQNLGHTNYLVVSVINGDSSAAYAQGTTYAPGDTSEFAGGKYYDQIIALNANLKSTYGARFVDVRSPIVAAYDPSNPQDVINHSNDVTPSSLRRDWLHLNSKGLAIVAQEIWNVGSIVLGWSNKTPIYTNRGFSNSYFGQAQPNTAFPSAVLPVAQFSYYCDPTVPVNAVGSGAPKNKILWNNVYFDSTLVANSIASTPQQTNISQFQIVPGSTTNSSSYPLTIDLYCFGTVPPALSFSGVKYHQDVGLYFRDYNQFEGMVGNVIMNSVSPPPLKYVPGCVPFSTNFNKNTHSKAFWRGIALHGYMHPVVWAIMGLTEYYSNVVSFWWDAQQDYLARTGTLGPLTPVYLWPRIDNENAAGQVDIFDFDIYGSLAWPGYNSRFFYQAARLWHYLYENNMQVPTNLQPLLENYLVWLNNFITTHDGLMPTEFPVPPQTPYNAGYDPTQATYDLRVANAERVVHITAANLAALCSMYLAGCRHALLQPTIEACMTELEKTYLVTYPVGAPWWNPADMTGSYSSWAGGHYYYGFHAGELFRGLAMYILYKKSLYQAVPVTQSLGEQLVELENGFDLLLEDGQELLYNYPVIFNQAQSLFNQEDGTSDFLLEDGVDLLLEE